MLEYVPWVVTVVSVLTAAFYFARSRRQSKLLISAKPQNTVWSGVSNDNITTQTIRLFELACLGFPQAWEIMEAPVEPFLRSMVAAYANRSKANEWTKYRIACWYLAVEGSGFDLDQFHHLAMKIVIPGAMQSALYPIRALDTNWRKDFFSRVEQDIPRICLLIKGKRWALTMNKQQYAVYLRHIGVSEARISRELQHAAWNKPEPITVETPLTTRDVSRQLEGEWTDFEERIQTQIDRARGTLSALPLEKRAEIEMKITALESRLKSISVNRALPLVENAVSEADGLLEGLETVEGIVRAAKDEPDEAA